MFPKTAAILLLSAVIPTAAPVPGAGAAAPSDHPAPNDLGAILSGDRPLDPISGEALRKNLAGDWRAFLDWVNREAASLQDLLVGWLAVLLVVLCGILILRRLRGRVASNRLSWRGELFLVLAEPLLILTGMGACFLFLVPILRSLPEIYTVNVRIFFTLITLCAAWGGMRLIALFSRRMSVYAGRDNNNLDILMVTIARKLLQIVLLTATFFFIGQSIFELNLTALLTGAGVAGLAIAFASRETLANFFGTIVIIADKPFRCGDRIRLNGVDGIVTDVGMRSTRIATADETVYTIPNSQIESSMVENISRKGVIQFVFTVPLVYDTGADDLRRALAILHELLDNFHGKDQERYKPHIFFEELGASGLNLKVIMWLKTAKFPEEEALRTEINLAVVERFRAAGLSFAFNTVTGCLQGDPAHPIPLVWTREAPQQPVKQAGNA